MLALGVYQWHRLEAWVGNITVDGKPGNLLQNNGGDGGNLSSLGPPGSSPTEKAVEAWG